MIDRAWRSLKFEWLPAHVNATQKKDGHTVLSPIVSELVFQCAWRQHQGPMSPTQFFTALQRLLKHWKNGTKRIYADVPCKKCWWTNVSASCQKWPKRHGRLCSVYLVVWWVTHANKHNWRNDSWRPRFFEGVPTVGLKTCQNLRFVAVQSDHVGLLQVDVVPWQCWEGSSDRSFRLTRSSVRC